VDASNVARSSPANFTLSYTTIGTRRSASTTPWPWLRSAARCRSPARARAPDGHAASSGQRRRGHLRDGRQGGFTLFETVIVIGLLTLVSLALLAMQPQIFKTQTAGRDEFVGVELMRGCAERLLAVRRNTGFSSVTSTLCNGMGGGGALVGWTQPHRDAARRHKHLGHDLQQRHLHGHHRHRQDCAPAANLLPITLQLSAY
jgi:hypothetical protein